jgi:hypothetical protein
LYPSLLTPVVVLLFAAMPQNVQLLQRSICLNPWLQDRISLFGLGKQQQQQPLLQPAALLLPPVANRHAVMSVPYAFAARTVTVSLSVAKLSQ